MKRFLFPAGKRGIRASSVVPLALMTLFMCTACGCRPPGATKSMTAAGNPGSPAPLFDDITVQAGLDYRWSLPPYRNLTIQHTLGNGCAFLDFNNDGNLDILLVGPKLALYQGDGKGAFTEVSEKAGLNALTNGSQYIGCAVGDYDNDGWDDVYISGYKTGVLLHNNAGQRFENRTQEAGLPAQPWGTSAAFADVDGDGYLDLYVANYVVFGPETEPQFCDRGVEFRACGPDAYEPLVGSLFLNQGGKRFKDITKASGVSASSGKTLGVAFGDPQNNGELALALANDERPGDLFQPVQRTPGKVRYENRGQSSGTAFDHEGNLHGGMGIAWGDYDNDGLLDLFVTTFQDQPKSLYHNEGSGVFADQAYLTSLSKGAALRDVGFGCRFLDFDNDSFLDLLVANGDVQGYHVRHDDWSYRQRVRLFRNTGTRPDAFQDQTAIAGPAFQKLLVGRGLATGDIDNDGWVDALVTDSEGAPLLLRNRGASLQTQARRWLGVRLEGVQSNRNGLGAMLTVTLQDGRTLLRHCHADGSYLSSSDRRVHFGLGAADKIATLTVRWPSGRKDVLQNVPVDRYITVREGQSSVAGD